MTEAELFGRLDEGVEYLAGTPLAAPILRWAPDIAVMVPGTPSSAGTDTNFTDDLFYINGIEKRCSFLVVPKDMMSGASLGSHEPFFEEEDHNRADGRIHLYLTTTPRKRSGPTPSSEATRLQKKNDDSQQEGAPYNIPSTGSSSSRTTTGFNVVSVMTTEKRRFEGCLTLLQPYADIFGNRDKCNLIKTISAYAPTAKTLLPLHMSQIATLIPVLATKDVLTRGLSDIPVSLPLLGKKLVTLGPISIRELELDDKDEKKAAAAAKFAFEDDGASAAVKLKVKKVRLNPVSFSYLSQSAAAKQLFYDNYVDPRPGMETNIIGPRPFSDTTTGVAEVTLGKVNVKGSLRVFVYTGGNMDLRLHKPKVSIGSLTLDSTVTKINVMAVILKPILKCAIESALEDALSGGTFP